MLRVDEQEGSRACCHEREEGRREEGLTEPKPGRAGGRRCDRSLCDCLGWDQGSQRGIMDRTGQDRSGQDRTGQDRTGQDRRSGQDRSGQVRTGQDRTGQDSQDRLGQDRTGQDRTGQDRTVQDRLGQQTGNQDGRRDSSPKVKPESLDHHLVAAMRAKQAGATANQEHVLPAPWSGPGHSSPPSHGRLHVFTY
ncbi:unnamed protein product [Pleuronectes platessa]|uniref:Uncharacterized protein n=1 Tax=Pleuronectes platessa TaxID=8262 RepID=A0A9N7VAS5_PLEPL|nr:unnamed protein product [Pleuronectes platessa]